MTDERDRLVALEARFEALTHLVERQESLCANRAATHVEERRWAERMDEIRRSLHDQGERFGKLEIEQDRNMAETRATFTAINDRQNRFRGGLIIAAVGPVLTILFALLFLNTGVGSGVMP